MICEEYVCNRDSTELSRFLLSSDNSSLFHHQDFFSYKDLIPPNISPHHLIIRRKKSIVSYIPGAIKEEGDRRFYESPIFASCGGFVLPPKKPRATRYKFVDEIVDCWLDSLSPYNSVIVRPPHQFYSRSGLQDAEALEFILRSKGFSEDQVELGLVVKLPELTKNGIHPVARREAAKALERGFSLSLENGVSESVFSLVLEQHSKRGIMPTHSLEELRRIEHLFPGSIVSVVCRGPKSAPGLAGVAVLFRLSETLLNLFYSATSDYARHIDIGSFIYRGLLDYAVTSSYQVVDLGISTFGTLPHHDLIFFKEKFGAVPYLRRTFTLSRN